MIYESFLSPWWDAVAFSQNFGLCQELNLYLWTTTEDFFFKYIKKKSEFLESCCFNKYGYLRYASPSAECKFVTNLCINVLTYSLWTHYNSRLNNETGESPDIFENSWQYNCPTLLLIKKYLSPLGTGRCQLPASNSNSVSTTESHSNFRQVISSFLSQVSFFFFCVKNRSTFLPTQSMRLWEE